MRKLLFVALLASLVACGPEPAGAPPAAVWPAGTVLALDGVPISAEQVDELPNGPWPLPQQIEDPAAFVKRLNELMLTLTGAGPSRIWTPGD